MPFVHNAVSRGNNYLLGHAFLMYMVKLSVDMPVAHSCHEIHSYTSEHSGTNGGCGALNLALVDSLSAARRRVEELQAVSINNSTIDRH